LGNAALWCCTELTTRGAIDTAVGLLSEDEDSARSTKQAKEKEEAAGVTR
jgi:hypothetical protein